MSALQTIHARLEAPAIGRPIFAAPSHGIGRESAQLAERLESARSLSWLKQSQQTPSKHSIYGSGGGTESLQETLFNALARYKVQTSQVVMHLDRDWRDYFFTQLDNLLDKDEWQEEDLPPSNGSFSTFLRMLIFLKPQRRPGLAASHDGRLIATWSSGADHLTIECLPQDIVRWNLVANVDGEKERAAAMGPVQRLPVVLRAYAPERWFANAVHIP